MNRYYENRDILIGRVKKEIVGPGSDIFDCLDIKSFSDEVIEGKPLQRYFSGILFPKQKFDLNIDEEQIEQLEDNASEIDIENDEAVIDSSSYSKDKDNLNDDVLDSEEELTTESSYASNTFFPSQFGISFCVSKNCTNFEVQISFGTYKKAKFHEISLPYNGLNIELLSQFGFEPYLMFDENLQMLKLKKEINKTARERVKELLNELSKDHRNSTIFKSLTKLFFKEKYKRTNHILSSNITPEKVLEANNQHLKFKLSKLDGFITENVHKDQIENLFLHVKLYQKNEVKDKYFIKAVIESSFEHPKKQFSNAKEKLNQLCLFQTEIKVNCQNLKTFNDYKAHLYKSEEDKMLDYLFKNQLLYGIGHNTSCTWSNCSNNDETPIWISSTFLPEFDVKSQSTESERVGSDILRIKSLSAFGEGKISIINNLKQITFAYYSWIIEEKNGSNNDTLALENIKKCEKIHQRILKGIDILDSNSSAFEAFRLSNTAIYLQMFQSEQHFNEKKDGYEIYERSQSPQYEYNDYEIIDYPNNEKQPAWRPFQLAFILQCIPSFVEENCEDLDLVDLLYFPTGGGKTEAYLAVSAFLIFWRRLQYPNKYDGVNVIIRYTLRLLSAQQFERASKLILACEFIRRSNKEKLGVDEISIGFWVGDKTIPNSMDRAEAELTKIQKKLNDGKLGINPFQLANCQWCNTKIISKATEFSNYVIGHRIGSKKLISHCLNPKCIFHAHLPVVLIDDDIYKKPPTILFATVDKFARLAWKDDAINLFNYGQNRKPELIIQDELHLINGPLGSLVGLFENVVLSLCTTETQRPKIIASTATIKNVENQISGLYGKKMSIFPQYATNSDDTFFSKTQQSSKRRYVGVLPTGKSKTMTSLRLTAALLLARLEIWQKDKDFANAYWTILSYYKSLKEIGRFSNKITSELKPEIEQLQVRNLLNNDEQKNNYLRLDYKNLELTSRIPNEKIKKNLDKLDIEFKGNLKNHEAYDLVLATNMISVGLDVQRLNIMIVNGMPSNTAEYIQASSRVARRNEGVVFTLFDPNNTRDLSYFEDFIPFHKTFYKQVEPLSVTPFAENALNKMLFTVMISYFRHKLGYNQNKMAGHLKDFEIKDKLVNELKQIFECHIFASVDDKQLLFEKIDLLIEAWDTKIDSIGLNKLFFNLNPEKKDQKSLMTPLQEKNENNILVGMQSMRSVEPSSEIIIKKY